MIKRNKKRNIFSSIIMHPLALTGYGLLILMLIAIPLYKNAKKQYNINKEIKELKKEIAGIEGKNTELRDLMEYLETDQFAEEQARLNLNLRKEGEAVAVIKDKDADSGANESAINNIYNIEGLSKEATVKEESNPRRWIRFFFGQ